jgi:hypothetical protein
MAQRRPCLAAGSSCRHRTECRWCCWRRRQRGNSCHMDMARARSMTRCSCWVCRIACRTLQALVRKSSTRFGKCSRQCNDSRHSRYHRNSSSRGWRCRAGCSRWTCWSKGSSARGQTRWRTCPPRSTRTRLGRRERWLCRGRRERSQCCRRRRKTRRSTASASLLHRRKDNRMMLREALDMCEHARKRTPANFHFTAKASTSQSNPRAIMKIVNATRTAATSEDRDSDIRQRRGCKITSSYAKSCSAPSSRRHVEDVHTVGKFTAAL